VDERVVEYHVGRFDEAGGAKREQVGSAGTGAHQPDLTHGRLPS
jgi:hypothetical protein